MFFTTGSSPKLAVLYRVHLVAPDLPGFGRIGHAVHPMVLRLYTFEEHRSSRLSGSLEVIGLERFGNLRKLSV